MAYINLLKYMQAFQVSGELVSMIIGIAKGIGPFTAILGKQQLLLERFNKIFVVGDILLHLLRFLISNLQTQTV